MDANRSHLLLNKLHPDHTHTHTLHYTVMKLIHMNLSVAVFQKMLEASELSKSMQ